MRFIELFEDSQEQQELKSLIKTTDDQGALAQIVNYLKSKVSKTKPSTAQTVQKPIVTPAEKDNSANKTITNEDSANLKAQALQLIDQLEDPSELEKLISFLRRAEITELSKRVIASKLGSVQGGIDKKLSALLTRIKNPFEQKIEFLQKILQQGGIFDGESLLNSKSGNIYTLTENDPIASVLAKILALEFRGSMGYGPDQGPGEIMMSLLGKNIGLANKGDLLIGNTAVEVKATGRGKKSWSGGRLYTTTGYGSSSNIRKMVYPLMVNAGIPKQVLQQYGWPNKEEGQVIATGGINFNTSGLENLSNLFKQYTSQAGAMSIIKAMLEGWYTKLPADYEKPILSLIQADGSFDSKQFLIELTKLAHKYYQFIEGHDALMLFNTENGNYAIIQDANDFDQLFNSGKVALTSHLDWYDDRSKGSSQIILK